MQIKCIESRVFEEFEIILARFPNSLEKILPTSLFAWNVTCTMYWRIVGIVKMPKRLGVSYAVFLPTGFFQKRVIKLKL